MIVTRKIGTLIRGKTTPFQIYAACLLGGLIGFLPGFSHAPFLMVLWSFLLLVLNANLFLAGIVGLLSKLVLLAAMPLVFALGRLLLEGPTQGLFRLLVNAPVTAYSGLDYYVVAGGQLLAVVLGLVLGFALVRSLNRYRRKMAAMAEGSEKMKAYSAKPWVKVLKFLFLGKGRGKKSYEQLLAVRFGNPIRIWGAAVALVLAAVLVLGFRQLSEPLLTSLAKSNLESANGATVDLESVDLALTEGKLEVLGLAMADAQDLDTNVFESRRIVADVSAADLLRKRFSVDHLVIEDAATGAARATPGSQIGPKPKTDSKVEMPDFDDLEGVLQNGKVWKERLAQAKRWLEQLMASDGEEKAPTWREELDSRIRTSGYANVKADFLTEGSPTFWIRSLEARGIRSPYFDGAKLDLTGSDLSTHPSLVATPPTLDLVADNDRFETHLSLAGASGTGSNDLKMSLRDYPVDAFASKLKSSGEPPLAGGTMDIDLGGTIGVAASDLLAQVSFDGSTARIGGNPVSLDGVTLPLAIRGPIDSPGVKLESDALEKILLSAGKKKLMDEAAKELGIDAESGAKPADMLRGLFDRKKKEE